MPFKIQSAKTNTFSAPAAPTPLVGTYLRALRSGQLPRAGPRCSTVLRRSSAAAGARALRPCRHTHRLHARVSEETGSSFCPRSCASRPGLCTGPRRTPTLRGRCWPPAAGRGRRWDTAGTLPSAAARFVTCSHCCQAAPAPREKGEKGKKGTATCACVFQISHKISGYKNSTDLPRQRQDPRGTGFGPNAHSVTPLGNTGSRYKV